MTIHATLGMLTLACGLLLLLAVGLTIAAHHCSASLDVMDRDIQSLVDWAARSESRLAALESAPGLDDDWEAVTPDPPRPSCVDHSVNPRMPAPRRDWGPHEG